MKKKLQKTKLVKNNNIYYALRDSANIILRQELWYKRWFRSNKG